MNKLIVRIKHLMYQYPDTQVRAINDVNLKVFKGEWLSLIGLNGSGKSTLIKLIDGLLPKKSGQIVIDGQPLNSNNLLSIRSKVGIVFQNPKDQFVGVTVKDEVAFGLENKQIPVNKIKKLVLKSLTLVGMRKHYNSLINNLSGGQQQRIAIADVIALKPEIIILDECTSMLDPQGTQKIMSLIEDLRQRFNLTVIDITHNVSETKYSQRVAIMSNGQLVMEGPSDKIFQRSKTLHQLHLTLPYPDILRNLLQDYGLRVPNHHFTETKMLSWLHQLFLNT